MHQPRCVLCLVFRYRASGTSGGMLQVLRRSSQENKLLWKIREESGGEWKDGHILLQSDEGDYQVCKTVAHARLDLFYAEIVNTEIFFIGYKKNRALSQS